MKFEVNKISEQHALSIEHWAIVPIYLSRDVKLTKREEIMLIIIIFKHQHFCIKFDFFGKIKEN